MASEDRDDSYARSVFAPQVPVRQGLGEMAQAALRMPGAMVRDWWKWRMGQLRPEAIEESVLSGGGPMSPGSMAGIMRGDSPAARQLIGLLRRVAPAVARGIDRLPDVRVATNVETLPSNVAGRYMPPFRLSTSERQKWPGGFLQLAPPSAALAEGRVVHVDPHSLLETLAHEGGHGIFYHHNLPTVGPRSIGAVPAMAAPQAERVLQRFEQSGDIGPSIAAHYRRSDPVAGAPHGVIEGLANRAIGRGWPAGLAHDATDAELLAALAREGRPVTIPPVLRPPRVPRQREFSFETARP
jgi:hypothetical protein